MKKVNNLKTNTPSEKKQNQPTNQTKSPKDRLTRNKLSKKKVKQEKVVLLNKFKKTLNEKEQSNK